jgi:integrase
MILNDAQRRGFIAHNPALTVKIDTKKRDKKKLVVGVDIPSKPHIQQLLALLGEPRWSRHRPLLVTTIFTGMRASELRGLVWPAVDLDKKMIRVEQRADEWGTIGMPKSEAGQREIPMAPIVLNTLREWRLRCPTGTGFVFPSRAGTVQKHNNIIERVWRPLQVAAGLVDQDGLPLYNFHTLRHFAASTMIEAGFSPKRLQALLGHSSIQMTFNVYGHLFASTEDDHAKFDAIERGIVG